MTTAVRIVMILATLVFLWACGYTVWAIWVGPRGDAEHVLIIAGSISSLWGWVSAWGWALSYKKVSTASSTRLLLGPRPEDAVELAAWKWGRQFRYAIITTIVCMVAIGFMIWLSER